MVTISDFVIANDFSIILELPNAAGSVHSVGRITQINVSDRTRTEAAGPFAWILETGDQPKTQNVPHFIHITVKKFKRKLQ
jgi:hypothetical protein